MKLIIYGAGNRGEAYYDLFNAYGLDELIYGYCDLKYDEIDSVYNKKVYSYDNVKDLDMPFLISLLNKSDKSDVVNQLKENNNRIIDIEDLYKEFGYSDKVSFNREICAFFHKKSMDTYFKNAESSVSSFWNKDTIFRQLFNTLNCTNIIELACGRGRHVPYYIDESSQVTLVDILPENIEYCKQRFIDNKNIHYYCNNGRDLSRLESDKYSALFSYDSMVHFEMMDIYSYLSDIHRVLILGGKALIHHSNNGSDYTASFAHMAYKIGFKILNQTVIDWIYPDFDCITLLEK